MNIHCKGRYTEKTESVEQFVRENLIVCGQDQGRLEDLEDTVGNIADTLARLLDVLATKEILSAPELYGIMTSYTKGISVNYVWETVEGDEQ